MHFSFYPQQNLYHNVVVIGVVVAETISMEMKSCVASLSTSTMISCSLVLPDNFIVFVEMIPFKDMREKQAEVSSLVLSP